MNSYAKKNNYKFEARPAGYSFQTIKFGSFQVIKWSGEWSAARKVIEKVSSKLSVKVIESGFHEKRDLLSSMFGASSEYAKVYSSGKLVGRIEMEKKLGMWTAKTESFV